MEEKRNRVPNILLTTTRKYTLKVSWIFFLKCFMKKTKYLSINTQTITNKNDCIFYYINVFNQRYFHFIQYQQFYLENNYNV